MSFKNIVVLVSGGGTNLQALIDAQKRGELGNGKITCVISSKADAYALTRAEENNINTRVLVRKDYADIASYSKAMRDALIEEKRLKLKLSQKEVSDYLNISIQRLNNFETGLRVPPLSMLDLLAKTLDFDIINPKKKIVTVYLFQEPEKEFDVKIYNFTDKIPVSIFDNLSIDFNEFN